jgi:hypothetical protein
MSDIIRKSLSEVITCCAAVTFLHVRLHDKDGESVKYVLPYFDGTIP